MTTPTDIINSAIEALELAQVEWFRKERRISRHLNAGLNEEYFKPRTQGPYCEALADLRRLKAVDVTSMTRVHKIVADIPAGHICLDRGCSHPAKLDDSITGYNDAIAHINQLGTLLTVTKEDEQC